MKEEKIDIFKKDFYSEAMNTLANIDDEEVKGISEIHEILLMERRKIKDCSTKHHFRSLCVQLIAENLHLQNKIKSLSKLIEEHLNG